MSTLSKIKNPELLKRFIGVGYFPKELPPPFTSQSLSNNFDQVIEKWSGNGLNAPRTRSDIYSIPRHGKNRRRLSIPNPVSHFYLSKHICESWDGLVSHMSKSAISLFDPSPSKEASRVFDPIDFDHIEASKNTILSRCDKAQMLDISRYYSTIYTHSIAWALHGKDWCKQNMHKKEFRESPGHIIDELVRKGQDGQSLGIPLGPDTSIVIAELIGAALDRELESELGLNDEIAFRYTDDFFIGLRDGRTPEQTMASVAEALSTYELEVSSEKTRTIIAASRADPDWALEISEFRLPTDGSRKRKALQYYFKTAFHLAQANAGQNVLSYCVSRSRSFDIDADSWATYEEFLLQCARANSTTVEMVARIIIDGSRAKMPTSGRWISHFIGDLARANAPLDYHWEVCWLLFLARELGIELSDEVVKVCERTESSAVGLLLLDLGSRDLAKVGDLKHRIVRGLSTEILRSPEWLLVYEGARLGWLGDAAVETVTKDTHFDVLLKLKVAFYDLKRTTPSLEKEKVREGAPFYDSSYFRF